MNNPSYKNIYLTIEIFCFILIALFCFGAWWHKPAKVFSLHEAVQSGGNTFQINADLIEVNLPTKFASHFQNRQIQALRLTNTRPEWNNSALSGEKLTISLDSLLQPNQHYSLCYYLLSFHQTPSSYDIRVSNDEGKVMHQISSGMLPKGEMLWRNSFGGVEILPSTSTFQLSLDLPQSKVFLCDFVIYDSPGMEFWNLDDTP